MTEEGCQVLGSLHWGLVDLVLIFALGLLHWLLWYSLVRKQIFLEISYVDRIVLLTLAVDELKQDLVDHVCCNASYCV